MVKSFKAYENIDEVCDKVIFEHEAEGIQEAEYQGKKVKLNDPIRGGSKKFYVYVKDGDKVKKYLLVIQQVYQSKETIPLDEEALELDIIVITQDQKQKQDIGLVINGELEQR